MLHTEMYDVTLLTSPFGNFIELKQSITRIMVTYDHSKKLELLEIRWKHRHMNQFLI